MKLNELKVIIDKMMSDKIITKYDVLLVHCEMVILKVSQDDFKKVQFSLELNNVEYRAYDSSEKYSSKLIKIEFN